ncbi:MAG: UDP-N-acetylglucosamine 2-epimerase (hydrolyzing) [Bacteroidales bacterium]|nr:UDP-N-acetylglucosamine 2-epimerase (hydrolyzing) [Bacteroidales bacterium]
MRIGLLTSTRADFGVYIPLIHEIKNDAFFELEIIAFGTHLSKKYGFTIDEITASGFEVKHQIQTTPNGDTPFDIANSIADTTKAFSEFWNHHKFDLVITIGDRYEMFAAVIAGSPFNVTFAHLHAGETTLGAIDNAYRHAISLMSKYLFVSTEEYKRRAIEINKIPDYVFNVGALSNDNLLKTELYSKEDFNSTFNIDLNKNTILSTFHPETVSLEKNETYIHTLLETFDLLRSKYQIIITMPNADTMGLKVRQIIEAYGKKRDNIVLIESFGMKGYLSCMKYCSFMIGNTSSGFVEAAFFPKWVINIGDRQKGRILTPNIKNVPVDKNKILESVRQIETESIDANCNIYGDGNAAKRIVEKIKKIYA